MEKAIKGAECGAPSPAGTERCEKMNLEELSNYLDVLASEDAFSGVVLLRQGEHDLLARAYGLASRAWKIPNTLVTRFSHASASKMFTAVAMLQLVGDGRVQLDQAIGSVLDLSGTTISPNATVAQLLTHTSGISDYFDEENGDSADIELVWNKVPNYEIRRLADMLPLFTDKPSLFDPGARHSYCNAGYVLLGLIVEAVSGVTYFDYVRTHIFARAKMADSDFISMDAVASDRADGHIALAGKDGRVTGWRTNIFAIPAHGSADGGAYTTAHDFARFLHALRNGQLLSAAMTRLMLAPPPAGAIGSGEGWSYGYGLYFLFDGERLERYGHGGEDPGASARVYHFEDHDIDMVILGNQSECAGPVGAKITGLLNRKSGS